MQKKTIQTIATILFLTVLTGFRTEAQPTFEKVPITGSIENFTTRLSPSGYTLKTIYYRDGKGYAELTKRKDDGTEHITVRTDDKREVNGIEVLRPERKHWAELLQDYTIQKTRLTKDYGAPTDSVEGTPADMNSPFKTLLDGTSQFRSEFKKNDLTIILQIVQTKKYGQVSIQYHKD